jgi:hypothetical protein
MQEIHESVQATVNSINKELRMSSTKNGRKIAKPLPDVVLVGGKPPQAWSCVSEGVWKFDTK